jgi:hypothetical protein
MVKKKVVHIHASVEPASEPITHQPGDPEWFGTPEHIQFQHKVQQIDREAEFSRKIRWEVTCSRCRETSTQRGDNDVTRLVEHRSSQKCLAAASGGKRQAITGFLGTAKPDTPLTSSTPSTSSIPSTSSHKPIRIACPGIGKTQNMWIPLYLKNTAASCGGAPPRQTLRKRITDARLSLNLSPFTPEDLATKVAAEERRAALWINSSSTLTVFSPECLKDVVMHPDGVALPCASCISVLKVHAFQTALKRIEKSTTSGKVKQHKFTPKAFRDPILGEIYASHTGIKELLVCPVFHPSSLCAPPDISPHRNLMTICGSNWPSLAQPASSKITKSLPAYARRLIRDAYCSQAIDSGPPVPLHRGLKILQPHRDLINIRSTFMTHQATLARFLNALSGAAASRPKRKRDDLENVVPSMERIKAAELDSEGSRKRLIIRAPGTKKGK